MHAHEEEHGEKTTDDVTIAKKKGGDEAKKG